MAYDSKSNSTCQFSLIWQIQSDLIPFEVVSTHTISTSKSKAIIYRDKKLKDGWSEFSALLKYSVDIQLFVFLEGNLERHKEYFSTTDC
jgi:hypothetical protein